MMWLRSRSLCEETTRQTLLLLGVAALLLGVTHKARAQESVWPRADSLEVDATVTDASLDPAGEVLSLRYVLSNDVESHQQVWIFQIEARSEILELASPGPTHAWFAARPLEDSLVRWAGARRDQRIAPGESRGGFEIRAAALPGIVQYWVQGYYEPPRIPRGQPIPDRPPVEDNSYRGFTVGPVNVDVRQPSGLTERLDSLTSGACVLDWINDPTVCTGLHATFGQVSLALSQGNNGGARTALESFIVALEAHHDPGPVNDNAYWLLKVNAEHVLERIADLGGGASTDTHITSERQNASDASELSLRAGLWRSQ